MPRLAYKISVLENGLRSFSARACICLFLCDIQFNDDPVVFRVHGFFYRLGRAVRVEQTGFPCFAAANGYVVTCDVAAVSLLCAQFHL